jgi:Yip1 domain
MEATPIPIPPAQPLAQTEPMSLWARLVNIFVTPGEVFDSLKAAPPSTPNWLVPAAILILISWIGGVIVFSQDSVNQQLRDITAKAVEKQIQKTHMPPAQAERARAAGEKYGSIGARIGGFTAPVFIALVTPFWYGLIIWLGAKVLGSNMAFMSAVEATGLTLMIAVLHSVIRTLLIIATGNLYASPSLVLLVKDYDPQQITHGLLGLTDVMVLWVLGLRSLALARLSGRSFVKSAGWVFGIWAIMTGGMLSFGYAMQAIFNKAH